MRPPKARTQAAVGSHQAWALCARRHGPTAPIRSAAVAWKTCSGCSRPVRFGLQFCPLCGTRVVGRGPIGRWFNRSVHRSRGTVVVALAVCLVGLPLLPLLHWASTLPSNSGHYPYIRWPGDDGAKTVNALGVVLFYLITVSFFFFVFLAYGTARHGPANLGRRTFAAVALGAATVTLALDWVYLINYLALVGYRANPD